MRELPGECRIQVKLNATRARIRAAPEPDLGGQRDDIFEVAAHGRLAAGKMQLFGTPSSAACVSTSSHTPVGNSSVTRLSASGWWVSSASNPTGARGALGG